MATLVFGTLGKLIGGPVGGAMGALVGRQLDRQIIGSPRREGPRLTELAVSGSSYGQPIARQFGTMRAAGTIIWATDLKESSSTGSAAKGQPRTTSYSYSVSLAVALSSRPITGVGRIWADGNLLRGAAGDMKTGGTLRIHTGHGDQPVDPLLAAALGARCPAHRGLAYAVFEDLQLADFGNRIPALSFEVMADGAGAGLLAALAESAPTPCSALPLPAAHGLYGFAHDGGSLAGAIDLIGEAAALRVDTAATGLVLAPLEGGDPPVILPHPVAAPDGDFGSATGLAAARVPAAGPTAIRYYDEARDYQPGLQRAQGRAPAGDERVLELPAALSADGALDLLEGVRLRARGAGGRRMVRVAALDRAIAPGTLVALGGEGTWRVTGWEWRGAAVELELVRPVRQTSGSAMADPGQPWRPADRAAAGTIFAAFELPWDGHGAADAARVHAALGAGEGRWAGAALYAERADALDPLGESGPARATIGTLVEPLGPSAALFFEPAVTLTVRFTSGGDGLSGADAAALASGANRLLVGEEVVQFAGVEPADAGALRLTGLLRGRGATEAEAAAGHAAGARVVLLDERLTLIDGARFDAASDRLAAIGIADDEAVFAPVASPGRSRRPPRPVHPLVGLLPGGDLALGWTRRARGAWTWGDALDVPLVEEVEAYEIGAGPPEAPLAIWRASEPRLLIPEAQRAALPPGTRLWVRQIGRHARSAALALHTLA